MNVSHEDLIELMNHTLDDLDQIRRAEPSIHAWSDANKLRLLAWREMHTVHALRHMGIDSDHLPGISVIRDLLRMAARFEFIDAEEVEK